MKHIETDILKPVALNLILQCQFVSFFFLFLYFFFPNHIAIVSYLSASNFSQQIMKAIFR